MENTRFGSVRQIAREPNHKPSHEEKCWNTIGNCWGRVMFLLWVFSMKICDRGDSDAWLNCLYCLQRLHFPARSQLIVWWTHVAKLSRHGMHSTLGWWPFWEPGHFVGREWRVLMNILAVINHASWCGSLLWHRGMGKHQVICTFEMLRTLAVSNFPSQKDGRERTDWWT